MPVTSGEMTLIATGRSSASSCARKTAPMPPCPRRRSRRYWPLRAAARRCWRSDTVGSGMETTSPNGSLSATEVSEFRLAPIRKRRELRAINTLPTTVGPNITCCTSNARRHEGSGDVPWAPLHGKRRRDQSGPRCHAENSRWGLGSAKDVRWTAPLLPHTFHRMHDTSPEAAAIVRDAMRCTTAEFRSCTPAP